MRDRGRPGSGVCVCCSHERDSRTVFYTVMCHLKWYPVKIVGHCVYCDLLSFVQAGRVKHLVFYVKFMLIESTLWLSIVGGSG